MSTWIGNPSDRWPLARAVDALGEAARQVARPGPAWIAGLVYPSIALGVTSFLRVVHPGLRDLLGPPTLELPPTTNLALDLVLTAGITLSIVLGFAPLNRLVAGLVRLSTRSAWRRVAGERGSPRLVELWRNGAGLTFSIVGLWCQFVVLTLGAMLLLVLPTHAVLRPLAGAIQDGDVGRALVAGSVLGALVVIGTGYLMAVSVLTQLALHSLAHNRRGVGSALLHGWRIVRHDPWATVRAVSVDLAVSIAFTAGGVVATFLAGPVAGGIVALLALAFVGCTRSAYWARAYRELGGLSPDDGVPGL